MIFNEDGGRLPSSKKPEMLPKKMALCAQMIRCGRVGCRCAAGQLHGPYLYRFGRVDGRLKKGYVRLVDAPKALSEQAERRNEKRRVNDAWALLRDLRSEVRDAEKREA